MPFFTGTLTRWLTTFAVLCTLAPDFFLGSIYMPIVAFNADFSRRFQPNRHVKQEARLPAGYESVVLTSVNNDDGTSVRE